MFLNVFVGQLFFVVHFFLQKIASPMLNHRDLKRTFKTSVICLAQTLCDLSACSAGGAMAPWYRSGNCRGSGNSKWDRNAVASKITNSYLFLLLQTLCLGEFKFWWLILPYSDFISANWWTSRRLYVSIVKLNFSWANGLRDRSKVLTCFASEC